jgi:hypothetical protein
MSAYSLRAQEWSAESLQTYKEASYRYLFVVARWEAGVR